MKTIMLLIVLIIVGISGTAQELDLAQILNKYYIENALEKYNKVNSLIMSGTITRNDLMPYKITRKRPNKLRVDFELADLEAVQAYDGNIGWSTAPWTGNPKPTQMPDDAIPGLKSKADFDGILFHWKEKGYLAELVGKEKVDHDEVYKIKVNRPDGGKEYFFIGTTDFLIHKQTTFRINKGREIEIVTSFKDYRKINGFWFAFVHETKMDGQIYSLIEFETIELDIPVEDDFFNMPVN